jgi:hypothetical protein
MKLPSLSGAARRRIVLPSALTVAALCLACPESPAPPPLPECGTPQASMEGTTCIDNAGCVHGTESVSCPAHGACNYGVQNDAEVVDACPDSQGPCFNVVAADGGAPLWTECQDQADRNAVCLAVTDYYADGFSSVHSANC